jgi:hypothetical protein
MKGQLSASLGKDKRVELPGSPLRFSLQPSFHSLQLSDEWAFTEGQTVTQDYWARTLTLTFCFPP